MTPKEKRQQEQSDIKEKRIEHILDCAFRLFAENGLDSVTMNDIAKEAEIGVASLYRYFVTKEELAIQCATQIWNARVYDFSELFSDQDYLDKNGLEQLAVIFSIFCEMFRSNRDFFRFIYFFDSFIHRNNVATDSLSKYEYSIGDSKDIVISAIQKGFNDGSIRKELNAGDGGEMLYFTITHSLFSMGQKLSLTEEMLNMDRNVPGTVQMQLLSRLLIQSLKPVDL